MFNLKFSQLLEMRRQMAQFFSAAALRQGYALYDKKAVSELGQTSQGTLQARVANRPRSRKKTHEVFVLPDRLESSSCTCRQPFCAHLAALLFAVLGQYMDAVECYHWLMGRAGGAAAAPGDNEGGNSKATAGGARAAALQRRSAVEELSPADEPALWPAAWQELWFGGSGQRPVWQRLLVELPALDDRCRFYWQKVQELSSGWPLSYRINFALGALVHLAVWLEEAFSELESHLLLPTGRAGRSTAGAGRRTVTRPEDLSSYFFHARLFCGQVLSKIEDEVEAVGKSLRVDLLPRCTRLWQELLPLLGRQVLSRTGDDAMPLLDWQHLYRMVSIAVLTEPADLERELVRLKRLGKEHPDWQNNREYILLLGHITYLRYGLAEAIPVWDRLDAVYPLWPYVYGVAELGEGPLLLEWLEYMSWRLGELARWDPRMVEQEDLQEDIQICLDLWQRLLRQDRREQVQHAYQSFLQQMLPCGSVLLPLLQHYAEQKQRQQVTDVFLLLQNIVLDRPPGEETGRDLQRVFSVLRPAEQLPCYHQKVEILLEKRCRENYRQAAQLLVQMRRLYNKLGRLEEWERYCQRLQDKYSRLRLFKEMLQREQVI
ncbi:MAG: hypothetical protein ACUVTU_10670 [Desulfurispora sp.]|uniref:hypothetical protein n=1 Tax=Desulfurispora sp. TaxID=3014275 RepID=UPI00404AC8A6